MKVYVEIQMTITFDDLSRGPVEISALSHGPQIEGDMDVQ